MKRIGGLIVLIGIGMMATVEARERVNIDRDWKFHLGDPSDAKAIEFDASEWRTLDLPHDWSIEAKFNKNNSGRNAWLPGGIGWYRREVSIPANYKGSKIEIQFDGIYRRAEVWVNGQSLGIQHDGYTSFYYDITPFIRFGKPNIIAVRVDNSGEPNCRWYTGSGIYRHVWLTQTAPLHVANWGTYITTPEVSASKAQVSIATTIEGVEIAPNFQLQTTLFNAQGEPVGTATTAGRAETMQLINVDSPDLWSIDSPSLYTAVSRLTVGNQVVDEYTSTFGIRELKFDAKKGFFLNGKNMKMKGVCVHHDAGTFGAAVPERVWERRLTQLKEIGCNAIRTAHNPVAPEFLDLCDRMGFLVMDEFVDKWDHKTFSDPHFGEEWEKNFRQTIRRDRNHPSVIIWSVGNENYHAGAKEQQEGLKRYCSFVRSIDPTRPVVSGMERGNDIPADKRVKDILKACSYMDLIALNYGEQWCKRIASHNPGKPYVSTESYRYFNSTEEVRNSNIERSPWIDVMDNDFNMGLFMWVGIDCLGEKRGSFKGIGTMGGLLDTAGFPKTSSYLYKAFWSEKPMVHIAVYQQDPDKLSKMGMWSCPAMNESWNLPKDKKVDLVTHSNCEEVELTLNGRKLGVQKMIDFPNWIMKWREIAYEPGTLRAVGLRDGKPVCEDVLITAGNPSQIQLVSSEQTVAPNGIAHVEVQLLDAQGNPVKHVESELKFSVKGGEVLGLDNGALTVQSLMTEKKTRPTDQGRCLCILRAGSKPGSIVLTVSAKGCPTASINIDVAP
jgi:beta-galactosidase